MVFVSLVPDGRSIDIADEETTIAAGNYKLADLLVQTNLAASKGEARRLIEQGGVRIDGERASNASSEINLQGELLFQVGKRRFLKVRGE